MYKLPERRGGRGGGEEIWAMPERKHSFFQEVFPKANSRVPLISQNVPEGLHNGFLGAILCQSHPKKISDFYLHF